MNSIQRQTSATKSNCLAMIALYLAVAICHGTSILETRITPFDPTPGDKFGHSIAISGNTLLVGAPFYNTPGSESRLSSAYVFVRNGSSWMQEQKLTADDIAPGDGDLFGYTVAIDGDTAVIGNTLDNDLSGILHGSAYVFQRTGGRWAQQQKLLANDVADGINEIFGHSVAISGDTIVIGCPEDHASGWDSGSAYVFVRSGSAWVQQQKITAPDASPWAFFGNSVAISANTILIGARDDSNAGTFSGAAYVFVLSGGIWTYQQKLTPNSPQNDYGWSVALDGNTAVVGGRLHSIGALNSGAAYVYVRTGDVWTQQQELTADDASDHDQLGYFVSIKGDTILTGTSAGSVYLFGRSGYTWNQQRKLSRSGESFGLSGAISEHAFAVGASASGLLSGSAYVYTAGTPQDAIRNLAEAVGQLQRHGALNRGQANSLLAKLDAAIRLLDSNNSRAAANQLLAFVAELRALMRSGRLPVALSDSLINSANEIVILISP